MSNEHRRRSDREAARRRGSGPALQARHKRNQRLARQAHRPGKQPPARTRRGCFGSTSALLLTVLSAAAMAYWVA